MRKHQESLSEGDTCTVVIVVCAVPTHRDAPRVPLRSVSCILNAGKNIIGKRSFITMNSLKSSIPRVGLGWVRDGQSGR